MKKFAIYIYAGLAGKGPWDEALNDAIVQTLQEILNNIMAKISPWKVMKSAPEPENSEQIIAEMKAYILKKLDYIKSVKDTKGKKFLVGDKVTKMFK